MGVSNKSSYNDHLKAHILLHTGEKLDQYSSCEKLFSHQYSFKTHMLTHMGENKCLVNYSSGLYWLIHPYGDIKYMGGYYSIKGINSIGNKWA